MHLSTATPQGASAGHGSVGDWPLSHAGSVQSATTYASSDRKWLRNCGTQPLTQPIRETPSEMLRELCTAEFRNQRYRERILGASGRRLGFAELGTEPHLMEEIDMDGKQRAVRKRSAFYFEYQVQDVVFVLWDPAWDPEKLEPIEFRIFGSSRVGHVSEDVPDIQLGLEIAASCQRNRIWQYETNRNVCELKVSTLARPGVEIQTLWDTVQGRVRGKVVSVKEKGQASTRFLLERADQPRSPFSVSDLRSVRTAAIAAARYCEELQPTGRRS